MNKSDYKLDKLCADLELIKEKVNYYISYINNVSNIEEIDFDISKRLKVLKIKVSDITKENLAKNINSSYFLIDLWQKEIQSVEDYFLDNQIKTDIYN
jgi:post-segregation antitoxin (ccd killing protein)